MSELFQPNLSQEHRARTHKHTHRHTNLFEKRKIDSTFFLKERKTIIYVELKLKIANLQPMCP